MTDGHHEHPLPPGAIVVGIDESPLSARAVDWATDQAAREGRRLVVVPATDPRRAQQLVRMSRTAHLVVVGSRAHGTWLAGLAECPVVVVPDLDLGSVRQGVLVGVPATSAASTVLDFACRQAALNDLPLSVVQAAKGAPGSDDDRRRWLSEAIGGMGNRFPDLRVASVLLPGRPAVTLLRMAERTSLLVVGRRRTPRLRWSASGQARCSILDRMPCPTAVVPAR